MHNIKQYFESQINEWTRTQGEYSETNMLYFMKEESHEFSGGKHVNLQILTTTRAELDQLATELANYEYLPPEDSSRVVWPKFVMKKEKTDETK